jgi:galactokinase
MHSVSAGETHTVTFSPDEVPHASDWTAYVRGSLAGCLRRQIAPGSLDLLIDSTVPWGGGLSSSAALEVATATLIEAVTGQTLDPLEKARLCRHAEHEYAHVPCGIMDQFTSVMATADHLLLLDCRDCSAQSVPVSENAPQVLIVDSRVKHELGAGAYAVRLGQCHQAVDTLAVEALRDVSLNTLQDRQQDLDPVVYRRARHVVSEIDRTVKAAEAVSAEDWGRMGELMYASHASLRDDYEVSCEELDLLVELARRLGPAQGVLGGRMTGGGFGGCTVNLVEPPAVPDVMSFMGQQYQQATGIQPALFVTRPARGAHVLQTTRADSGHQ